MNYNLSSVTHILVLLILVLFCLDLATARPWWNSNDGYDVNLDPVEWSRSFVKDQVRRTRHHNYATATRSKPKYLQFQLQAKKPSRSHKKSQKLTAHSKYHKKHLRRRQKMNARERYSHWRQ
ncbi:hypothetical protein KR018_001569 [Drosophila ironensis]|nr:hypothetical protein KR018_001569 [Drosophila ironensis]